jgi:hypothetical protein
VLNGDDINYTVYYDRSSDLWRAEIRLRIDPATGKGR